MQYQIAATRLRDSSAANGASATEKKLGEMVYKQAMSFLHLHMLPLKALPKILKHATPNGHHSQKPKSAMASISHHLTAPDTASQSSRSSAIESLEAEEKELRERLILLEEQKFIVGEALADAKKRRRFDDVRVLGENVEELSREVDEVQKMLGALDFAGAYALDGGG
jgi:hypothetical protein